MKLYGIDVKLSCPDCLRPIRCDYPNIPWEVDLRGLIRDRATEHKRTCKPDPVMLSGADLYRLFLDQVHRSIRPTTWNTAFGRFWGR